MSDRRLQARHENRTTLWDPQHAHLLTNMPIPTAIALLERARPDTVPPGMVSVLGMKWSREDINVAWNSISRSRLDPGMKQQFFTELWG